VARERHDNRSISRLIPRPTGPQHVGSPKAATVLVASTRARGIPAPVSLHVRLYEFEELGTRHVLLL
jgi:hypothetical protein